jgi:hypothetical protein
MLSRRKNERLRMRYAFAASVVGAVALAMSPTISKEDEGAVTVLLSFVFLGVPFATMAAANRVHRYFGIGGTATKAAVVSGALCLLLGLPLLVFDNYLNVRGRTNHAEVLWIVRSFVLLFVLYSLLSIAHGVQFSPRGIARLQHAVLRLMLWGIVPAMLWTATRAETLGDQLRAASVALWSVLTIAGIGIPFAVAASLKLRGDEGQKSAQLAWIESSFD